MLEAVGKLAGILAKREATEKAAKDATEQLAVVNAKIEVVRIKEAHVATEASERAKADFDSKDEAATTMDELEAGESAKVEATPDNESDPEARVTLVPEGEAPVIEIKQPGLDIITMKQLDDVAAKENLPEEVLSPGGVATITKDKLDVVT